MSVTSHRLPRRIEEGAAETEIDRSRKVVLKRIEEQVRQTIENWLVAPIMLHVRQALEPNDPHILPDYKEMLKQLCAVAEQGVGKVKAMMSLWRNMIIPLAPPAQ